MSVAHELVKNNLTTIAQTRSKTIDIPFYFKLKDEVFLFSPVLSKNTPKSFQEFWKGPYTIVEIISPVCYKIQNNSNPTDTDIVYASRLKKKF